MAEIGDCTCNEQNDATNIGLDSPCHYNCWVIATRPHPSQMFLMANFVLWLYNNVWIGWRYQYIMDCSGRPFYIKFWYWASLNLCSGIDLPALVPLPRPVCLIYMSSNLMDCTDCPHIVLLVSDAANLSALT